MSKKVLVINYYRSKSKNTKGVQEVTDAIEQAGGQAEVIHHTKALSMIKHDKDFLQGYDSFHATGSDITWKEKTDDNNQKYMDPGANKVATYLISQDLPGKFDCGSGQAAYHAIGRLQEGKSNSKKYHVKNTGKYNRKVINGIKHNHKYAMAADEIKEGDLEGKIRNIITLEHQGKNYVSSFNYGNKSIVQGHEARTEEGAAGVVKFHGLKPKKATSPKYNPPIHYSKAL